MTLNERVCHGALLMFVPFLVFPARSSYQPTTCSCDVTIVHFSLGVRSVNNPMVVEHKSVRETHEKTF